MSGSFIILALIALVIHQQWAINTLKRKLRGRNHP